MGRLMTRTGYPWAAAGPLAAVLVLLLAYMAPLQANAAEPGVDLLKPDVPNSTTFYGLCWKRDGSEALLAGYEYMLLTYRPDGGLFTRLASPDLPRYLFAAAWRPDSLYALVVGSDGGVLSFNGETLAPYCTTRSDYLRAVSWKADSSEALIVGSNGTILRFREGNFQVVPSGTTADLYSCSWHPRDGTALISGFQGTLLRLQSDGTVEAVPFEPKQSLYAVSWDPAGNRALITGNNSVIATYDGTSMDVISQGVDYRFLGCCWNPDGQSALICGGNGMLLRYAGGRLVMIETGLGQGPQLYGVAYRPQGDYALAAGYLAKVLRYPATPQGSEPCLLQNPLVIGAIVLGCVGALFGYYYLSIRAGAAGGDEGGVRRPSRRKARKK